MSNYYYDEHHEVAYKVDPIVCIVEGSEPEGMIVVQTDVKVTNLKKEKIRRTLLETYPAVQYDPEEAKEEFINSRLKTFMGGAKKIAEGEYEAIKSKYEAV